MFQIGGDFWKDWNAALLPAVLRKQDRRRNSVYYGSWPLDGRWGRGAGRIYQTALGVLILTTYYRYDRGPKTRVVPFTGDLYAALAPYFARIALAQIRRATRPMTAYSGSIPLLKKKLKLGPKRSTSIPRAR